MHARPHQHLGNAMKQDKLKNVNRWGAYVKKSERRIKKQMHARPRKHLLNALKRGLCTEKSEKTDGCKTPQKST